MKPVAIKSLQRRYALMTFIGAGMMAALASSKVSAQLEPESLRTANDAKTRIEEAARTFIRAERKAALAANRPTTIKYRTGKAHFDAARASLNAWLDTIALDLKSGRKIDEIDKRRIGVLHTQQSRDGEVDNLDKVLEFSKCLEKLLNRERRALKMNVAFRRLQRDVKRSKRDFRLDQVFASVGVEQDRGGNSANCRSSAARLRAEGLRRRKMEPHHASSRKLRRRILVN